MERKKFVQFLEAAHLRATESRIAILQLLFDKHGPFTVEEIHKKITKSSDLATVYRALGNLEKAELIRKCEFGDGTARYELSEHKNHHHHHVICRSCKQIEVLDDCELQSIDRFAKKKGYTAISHSLEFFGVCPRCSGKS